METREVQAEKVVYNSRVILESSEKLKRLGEETREILGADNVFIKLSTALRSYYFLDMPNSGLSVSRLSVMREIGESRVELKSCVSSLDGSTERFTGKEYLGHKFIEASRLIHVACGELRDEFDTEFWLLQKALRATSVFVMLQEYPAEMSIGSQAASRVIGSYKKQVFDILDGPTDLAVGLRKE
jgi:hypothetical protein